MLISPHMINQKGSTCCNTFLTVTPCYHSKMTLGGSLDAEKLAEAILLYVFNIAFPVSLLITTAFVDQPLAKPGGQIVMTPIFGFKG